MSGTFQVEWLPGGVLLQRRTGMFTIDEATAYSDAVKKALETRPSRWGAIIDARGAVAQSEEVQAVFQDMIRYVEGKNIKRVAFVSSSVVTGIQEKRVATAPGMHSTDTMVFFTDYDAALADVREALYR